MRYCGASQTWPVLCFSTMFITNVHCPFLSLLYLFILKNPKPNTKLFISMNKPVGLKPTILQRISSKAQSHKLPKNLNNISFVFKKGASCPWVYGTWSLGGLYDLYRYAAFNATLSIHFSGSHFSHHRIARSMSPSWIPWHTQCHSKYSSSVEATHLHLGTWKVRNQ